MTLYNYYVTVDSILPSRAFPHIVPVLCLVMSPSPPESHPPFDASNSSAKCPVTGLSHEFAAPKDGDNRSPCPALNAMANHGYIPRDGKNVTATDIYYGLQKCYGLNAIFAGFLSYGGYLALLKLGRAIPLYEIGRHNKVEHNASLVHRNTPKAQKYAPIEVDPDLVDDLFNDIRPTAEEVNAQKAKGEKVAFLLGLEDLARARIRREKEAGPLNRIQARVARGEFAIVFGVFGTTIGEKMKMGIPADFLRTWIQDERLPDGWKPTHSTGFFDLFSNENKIRLLVNKMRAEESAGNKKLD